MEVKSQKKVVIAYSGGLDTSYCVVHLKEAGFEVHAVSVNTGGFEAEEVAKVKETALLIGADYCHVIDAKTDFYDQCLRYLIAGNVLRNQTYPCA